ncbi:C-X-C motif chemokine 13 [Rhinopithecus roxellana]|uniref:C-X-C motif chemokine n=2 Tax=Rhinopithecus TaxID=542827 RepID=A0A2K6LCT4_RHIBE|nr:C-X-C motif chemokine 13 [Rhinopithecus roxellana]XP_017732096.1 PREDICTED: C-X-C motif chemokine 13 [Rhinopithecus bieti]
MKFISASLLLMLLVSSLSPVQGVLEVYYTHLRCRCVQESSLFIPRRFIDRIQISPRGNGCPRKEIIVWKKNKSVVCVDPQAEWIQRIMETLRKKISSAPPVPVFKRKIP